MKFYPGMAALKKTANFEYKQRFLNQKFGYNPKFSYESTVINSPKNTKCIKCYKESAHLQYRCRSRIYGLNKKDEREYSDISHVLCHIWASVCYSYNEPLKTPNFGQN
jgi:hypothetical protein